MDPRMLPDCNLEEEVELILKNGHFYSKIQFSENLIVTTPTTTSTQPNLTTIKVGLDTKMTLHHPPTTETFRPVL